MDPSQVGIGLVPQKDPEGTPRLHHFSSSSSPTHACDGWRLMMEGKELSQGACGSPWSCYL